MPRLALGTMAFDADVDEQTTAALLDLWEDRETGLIDTGAAFGRGLAEARVAAWLACCPRKSPIATRVSLRGQVDLRAAVHERLRALRVTQVALVWLYAWDGKDSDQVRESAARLLGDGDVRAIGASDSPAWIVAREATLFTALQLEYGPLARDVETDLLPLAHASGLSAFAWGVTSGGVVTGNDLPATSYYARYQGPAAQRLANMPSSRALAATWVQQRGATPILGPRSAGELTSWLDELAQPHPDDVLAELSALAPPRPRFPAAYLEHPDSLP